MKTIKLTVDKKGGLTIDADGFPDKSCAQYIDALLDALNTTASSHEDKTRQYKAKVNLT